MTAAHKVRDYTRQASSLVVRLGDWNPNGRDDKVTCSMLILAIMR